MEFGLDSAIERLNALKLQAPLVRQTSDEHGNQREERAAQQDLHPHPLQAEQQQQQQQQFAAMMQRMQDEYERKLKEQEQYLQRMQHEMQQMQRRVGEVEHQNHLLRNAVGVVDTYKAQVADQQHVIGGLEEQVKQLRLTNYRLQYMVQQNERNAGPSHFLPPPPPDIF